MVHEAAADLFPDTHNSAQLQVINGRCLIRTQESLRVITVSGVVLSHYEIHDQMAEAFAMVSLVEQGWATQREVAAAFKHSSRTLRRYQRPVRKGRLGRFGSKQRVSTGASSSSSFTRTLGPHAQKRRSFQLRNCPTSGRYRNGDQKAPQAHGLEVCLAARRIGFV